MIRDGLCYLATTDPTTLAVQSQAECLQTLERVGGPSAGRRHGRC
jgi:hypothetical protein